MIVGHAVPIPGSRKRNDTPDDMATKAGNITIDARTTSWGSSFVYHMMYAKEKSWVAHYEHRVVGLLNAIRATRTGAAILDSVVKRVTIRPLENPFEVNAFASPRNCRNAIELLAEPVGCRPGAVWELGTGMGTASTIYFTPGTYSPGDPLMNKRYKHDVAGKKPDEVLCHELVHAMRHTQGELDRRPMGDGFDKVDEFHAIMVANIYCSERGRPLRRNHHGSAPMQHEFATDGFRFYAWYNKLVSKFVSDLPELARQLSRINCPWNPVREHFEYQQILADIAWDRQASRPGYYRDPLGTKY